MQVFLSGRGHCPALRYRLRPPVDDAPDLLGGFHAKQSVPRRRPRNASTRAVGIEASRQLLVSCPSVRECLLSRPLSLFECSHHIEAPLPRHALQFVLDALRELGPAGVSKSGTARWVQPPPELFEAVTRNVPRDDRVPDRHVFMGFGGARFRTAITRACTASGVPTFSPHDLRHRRVSLLHLGVCRGRGSARSSVTAT